MSTPRKHWFRVADAIAREAFSNDELAFLIRLMAELNTRWARDGLSSEDACELRATDFDLMALAAVQRPDAALGILGRLQEKLTSLTVRCDGISPGVYFVHAGNRLKIGKTSSLSQRLGVLRRAHPGAECIGWIPSLEHARLERHLHEQFAEVRIEGEWFDATAELLAVARRSPVGSAADAPAKLGRRPAVVIRWEKWTEFQQLRVERLPRELPEMRRRLPSPQDAPARRKKEEKNTQIEKNKGGPEVSAASQPSPETRPVGGSRKKMVKTSVPEDLPLEAKRDLKAWAEKSEPWAVPRLRELVDDCLQYHRSEGKDRANWYATCQRWITGARTKYGMDKGPGPQNGGKRRETILDASREIARELGLGGATPDDDEAFFDVSPVRQPGTEAHHDGLHDGAGGHPAPGAVTRAASDYSQTGLVLAFSRRHTG